MMTLLYVGRIRHDIEINMCADLMAAQWQLELLCTEGRNEERVERHIIVSLVHFRMTLLCIDHMHHDIEINLFVRI